MAERSVVKLRSQLEAEREHWPRFWLGAALGFLIGVAYGFGVGAITPKPSAAKAPSGETRGVR